MVFVPPTFIAEYRVARKFSLLSTNGWWLNRWPLLGWLETGLKVLAWFYSSYVGIETVPIHKPKYGSEPAVFVLQTFLMCGGTTLLTLAVVDRLRYREVVSMIFVFPNAWAHWVVVSAMLRLGPAGLQARNFRMFCWLMLSGDIVKLLFFAVHDFTMLEVKRYVSRHYPQQPCSSNPIVALLSMKRTDLFLGGP